MLYLYRQSSSKLQHRGNLVSLQVQTEYIVIGENYKQAGTSFRKNTAQKTNHIKNNPLGVIVTLLTIYWKVPLSIINVETITLWDLLKMLCMGTLVAEINKHPLQEQRENLSVHPRKFQQEDLPHRWKFRRSQGPEKKLQAKAGLTRLPSNWLLLYLTTKWYPSSTGKGSSQKIGLLECLGYSEPRWHSLVKFTQSRMGICWDPLWQYHRGIQTDNYLFVW